MLHTKVHGNPSTCSKEEDFKAFYHIWTRKPSGHVTNIILICFHFLAYVQNLVKKGQVVSEKKQVLILICK